MNEMTAAKAAENFENEIKNFELSMPISAEECIRRDTICFAASILRRTASGELTEVRHVHWKEVEPGHDILFECSNCGRIISTSWGCCEDKDTKGCNGCDPTEEWLYCPTCGALMNGKDDSHENN